MRQLTYETVKYGMLVEVLDKDGDGYHSGCKVHFFNKKGVLVGNYYEFLPYERLRIREPFVDNGMKTVNRNYQRFYMDRPFEKLRTLLFKIVLGVTGRLLRWTQPIMD